MDGTNFGMAVIREHLAAKAVDIAVRQARLAPVMRSAEQIDQPTYHGLRTALQGGPRPKGRET